MRPSKVGHLWSVHASNLLSIACITQLLSSTIRVIEWHVFSYMVHTSCSRVPKSHSVHSLPTFCCPLLVRAADMCAHVPVPAAVSRAFSCLSDAQKRAAYDRYGEETPGMSGRANGAGPGHPFAQQEFDPEELFNMFFNGGFGGTRCAGCRHSIRHETLMFAVFNLERPREGGKVARFLQSCCKEGCSVRCTRWKQAVLQNCSQVN